MITTADMTDTRSARSVRLPFAYGERVYHRARTEKVVGIVTGFHVRQDSMLVIVAWGDDVREMSHYFYELTTEFSPFEQEPQP